MSRNIICTSWNVPYSFILYWNFDVKGHFLAWSWIYRQREKSHKEYLQQLSGISHTLTNFHPKTLLRYSKWYCQLYKILFYKKIEQSILGNSQRSLVHFGRSNHHIKCYISFWCLSVIICSLLFCYYFYTL